MTDRWRQIETLYHQALERSEEERPGFLDSACSNDPELKREVESLLANSSSLSGSQFAPAIDVQAREMARDNSPISAGSRLGDFTMHGLLGKGGMGEVYRAHDEKLGRDVAIKVLPASFVSDPDRERRFSNEARLLATLNHPNIATIYGLEEIDGRKMLILELVEGETLADRLKRGALSVKDALGVALQITQALEAAHEKGVIHRDLKPANIKITPESRVKVLDFGLAKAFAGPADDSERNDSRRMGMSDTIPGVVMGTAAYMAPEQARGLSVDPRADIFAFGTILYEMLTGNAAFARATSAETLARVLEGAANLNLLPMDTPRSVRKLIERCLQKNPAERLQHIGDARIEIRDALSEPAEAVRTPSVPSRRKFLWTTVTAGIAGVLAGRVAAIWSSAEGERGTTSFQLGRLRLTEFGRLLGHLALSPDGSQVAYVSDGLISVRAMDNPNPVPVGAGRSPFFSPDGNWLAFSVTSQIRKVLLDGQTSHAVAKVGTRFLGGTWFGNTIVFSNEGALYRVADDGLKAPELLIAPNDGRTIYAWPHFLPDGRSILFNVFPDGSGDVVENRILDLETLTESTLPIFGYGPKYVQGQGGGYLVYATGRELEAVRFNARTASVDSTPLRIPDTKVSVSGAYHVADFDISKTGVLVSLASLGRQSNRELLWVDPVNGQEQSLGLPARSFMHPSLSRDGRFLAISMNADPEQGIPYRRIWTFDLRNNPPTAQPVSDGTTEDAWPTWSFDGTKLYFGSPRRGDWKVYWRSASGIGPENVLDKADIRMPWALTSKNHLLAANGAPDWDIALVNPSEPDESQWLFGHTPEYREHNPSLLPETEDFLLYDSDRSNQYEIYIRPYPHVEDDHLVVSNGSGGVQPRWGPRGPDEGTRWVYFRAPNGDMMRALVRLTPSLKLEQAPQLLFPNRRYFGLLPDIFRWSYDVAPDGKFLMLKMVDAEDAEDGDERNARVTLNWIEQLDAIFPEPSFLQRTLQTALRIAGLR